MLEISRLQMNYKKYISLYTMGYIFYSLLASTVSNNPINDHASDLGNRGCHWSGERCKQAVGT